MYETVPGLKVCQHRLETLGRGKVSGINLGTVNHNRDSITCLQKKIIDQIRQRKHKHFKKIKNKVE